MSQDVFNGNGWKWFFVIAGETLYVAFSYLTTVDDIGET